jgi:hypothetical protein
MLRIGHFATKQTKAALSCEAAFPLLEQRLEQRSYQQVWQRDRTGAASYLLAYCCTQGELYRLLWSDVGFGNQRLQLTTRRRKDGALERDYIPLTEELCQNDMFEDWSL